MNTSLKSIKGDIKTLATFTATPSNGVTRLPFTPESQMTKQYIKKRMLEAGLNVRSGGAFDGIAGVVAALEVARIINEQGIKNRRPLEIVAMDNEEGARFEQGMLSSRAMARMTKSEELDILKEDDGFTLMECMKRCGLEPNLKKVRRCDVKAFIELHIEQGPVLEMKQIDIGIVDKIVGFESLKVIVKGNAGHAGTTLMNMREDALVAAANVIFSVSDIAVNVGGDTVSTVGKVKVLPGAPNVIPEKVEFTIDVRSHTEENVKQVKRQLQTLIKKVEKQQNVRISIIERGYKKPVNLSHNISNLIEKEAQSIGLTTYIGYLAEQGMMQ